MVVSNKDCQIDLYLKSMTEHSSYYIHGLEFCLICERAKVGMLIQILQQIKCEHTGKPYEKEIMMNMSMKMESGI